MDKTPTFTSHAGGWGRRPSTGATLGLVILASTTIPGVTNTGYLVVCNTAPPKEAISNFTVPTPENVERLPSENLKVIRDYFKPAISDLASAFGVTRQSIYNWVNGAPVNEENYSKLQDLARAADVLVLEGIEMNISLLKRKFSGGKTLFQIVSSGGSAQEAARQLATVYKREQEQRAYLDKLRAKRQSGAQSADFDLPAATRMV
jgi:transcriptional regulator with XRE-family HTH domain|tara:strand:- start:1874 stop:2488 length:615 start_codon:yes stop_codon:yes gene_type:complete